MAKRYAVLQKKLEELELELKDAFNFPIETPSHQLLSENLDRRFGFFRSLLAAEMDSHPSKPHHLHHIDQRLTELETAFQEWDNSKTLPFTNHIDDNASTCSCTESCFDDDGDDDFVDMGRGEMTVYENPEFDFVEEKKDVEENMERVKEDVKEEKVIGSRNLDGNMRMVVLFGLGVVGLVMAWICYACFCSYKEDMDMEFFLTPT
ncbi:hypothetical protein IFM89_030072 [Coptis chinensis]|uniref:DUF7610 domain-containing protein n=1 Tax=Coptis chinensis TaxID=261450 RepID=A0A835IRS9_9MAGN|nr:hypothetical protein IFM89_030072 [Coptis chinensis]